MPQNMNTPTWPMMQGAKATLVAITIELDCATAAKLAQLAKSKGMTTSALIRYSIKQQFDKTQDKK